MTHYCDNFLVNLILLGFSSHQGDYFIDQGPELFRLFFIFPQFRNDSRLLPQTLPAAVRSAPECQALSLNKKTRRSHERNWRENNGGWMGTSFLMSLRESKGCRFSSDSDELVIVR